MDRVVDRNTRGVAGVPPDAPADASIATADRLLSLYARTQALRDRSALLRGRSMLLRQHARGAVERARTRFQSLDALESARTAELARPTATWSRVPSAVAERLSDDLDRDDVRRALLLLADFGRIGVRSSRDSRRATVRLSRFRGDEVPLGLDVLGILEGSGYVARCRARGPIAWFDLTARGHAAVQRRRSAGAAAGG